MTDPEPVDPPPGGPAWRVPPSLVLYGVGVFGLFLGLSTLEHPWFAGGCFVVGGVCLFVGFSKSLGEEDS